MKTGSVRWYDERRGYGYITPDGGGDDVRVHYAAIYSRPQTLKEGDKVSFRIVRGPRGAQAIKVTPSPPKG